MTAKITDKEFARVWNDTNSFPSVRDVASETGYTYKFCKNKARRIKRRHEEGKTKVNLIDRSAPTHSTLPEQRNEYFPDMTREQCLERLRGLYYVDPDKDITRLHFRRETGIADSTWTRYFGTFLEFKRQAGLEMTRHQHAVQRKLAMHAAADHYRDFNDRHELDGRYQKADGKGVKTVVGCSDLHDIEIDPFYLRVLIESCRMIQPDIINFGGDIFDLAEFGKYGVDPREWDVVGRIRFVHDKIFRPLREACPNAQFDFVEGNHEFRLLRHLADATPALQAVLSDLLGLTVPKLLGLDEFEINYIARADMAAYNHKSQEKEVLKSYKVYEDTVMVHHHPHAAKWGLPGWNGHHHHWKVTHHKSALFGAYQWLQLGCGHQLRASYTEGEYWTLGFNVCHYNPDTKSTNHEYINVTDMAIVGGMYFHRTADEMVGGFYKAA